MREALLMFASHPESLTPGGTQLLAATERLLDDSMGWFERRWRRLQKTIDDPVVLETERHLLCQEQVDLFHTLVGTVIPVLDGAEPQHIRLELDRALAAIVRTFSGGGDIPVLSSSYELNYSFSGIGMASWYAQLGLPLPDECKNNFAIFTIPRLERDSVGLHGVLLGHELGHYLERRFTDAENLTLDDGSFQPLSQDASFDDIAFRRDVVHRATNWIIELVSDAYSALLLGPAALLSLAEVAAFMGSDHDSSSSHPAPAYRYELIVAVLEQSGFTKGPQPEQEWTGINDFFGSAGFAVGPREKAPLRWQEQTWTLVQPLLGRLARRCRANLPEDSVFTSAHWPLARRSATLLSTGYPAGEILLDGRPQTNTVPAILNGAWLVKAAGMESLAAEFALDHAKISTQVRLQAVLDQLLLKSLEIVVSANGPRS